MNDLIHASYEGICLLCFDRRDKGSVTSLKNYKKLQGRWFSSHKLSDKTEGDSEGRIIERGVHIRLRIGGGKVTSGGSKVESFVVNSTSTKGYNK